MRVSNLSKEELKALISEVVEEKLREYLDPDHGLEFREEFIQALETSIGSKKRIPFRDVKKKLGLN